MRILFKDFEFEPTRSNQAHFKKLPRTIRRWYEKTDREHLVSWVEGGITTKYGIYVRLISGMENWWRLKDGYWILGYRGSVCRSTTEVKAIKLTRREVEELARDVAEPILANADRTTRKNWTKAK